MYQFCGFSRKDGLHEVRRTIFDKNYNTIEVKEKAVDINEMNEMLQNILEHKRKVVPSRALRHVPYPTRSHASMADSCILNNRKRYIRNVSPDQSMYKSPTSFAHATS